MTKLYENAKEKAAFDRCIDVMSKLMQKYGKQVLQQHEKDMRTNETDFNAIDEATEFKIAA